jgi:hypothetical protein
VRVETPCCTPEGFPMTGEVCLHRIASKRGLPPDSMVDPRCISIPVKGVLTSLIQRQWGFSSTTTVLYVPVGEWTFPILYVSEETHEASCGVTLLMPQRGVPELKRENTPEPVLECSLRFH